VDNKTPLFGYLPGKMVVGVSEELKSLGVQLMNSKMDKTVCVDRRLITGSSPLASNELGKLSVKTLLEGLS
jgi:molecular chaperone Hsp31 and glyoxalase 3